MNRVHLLLSALVLTPCVHGQGEDDNWFFGSSNLLFGGGTPVSVNTSSTMNAQEGCASISDAAGQLLFYTDGTEAWNREHERFPTWPSNTFPQYTLGGGQSSAQAALIVPKPASDRYFYIFTVAESGFGYGPARYSVVDMTLDDGRGDILACASTRLWARGNILTIGDTTFHEKLTAVRHANGRDVWVIAHRWESDEFWAVPVTPCGVDTANVVVSAVGTFIGGFFNFPTCNDRGMLVASPQGNRLTMCNEGPAGPASLEIFDFDPATGVVSNPIVLPSPYPLYEDQTWCYGASFSPNGELLYVSSWYHPQLLQFDVTQPTAATIQASAVTVGTTTFQTDPVRGFGHLRLGPDGRLYASIWNTERLTVVPNPDTPGNACGFLDGSIQCLPSTYPIIPGLQAPVQKGLPAPVLPSRPLFPMADTLLACVGTPLAFALPSELDGACLGFVEWNFGDPQSGPLNTSTDPNALHSYAAPGIYLAHVVVDQGCEQDLLKVPVRVVQDTLSLPPVPSVTICSGEPVALTVPDLPAGATVTWSTGETGDTITTTSVGEYSFVVSLGCAADTGIVLVVDGATTPFIDLPDTTICAGDAVIYTAPIGSDTITSFWSDGTTAPFFAVTDTGTFTLTLDTQCGLLIDTFRIAYAAEPFVSWADAFTLCRGGTLELAAESLVGTFEWSAAPDAISLTVDRPGWYGYTLSGPCRAVQDSVLVEAVVCDTALACSTFHVPNAFTPDDDGINDRFAPVWDPTCGTTIELVIFDRWGEQIHTWRQDEPPWDGTYNNVHCPIGIYAYRAVARTTYGEQLIRTGHVALLR